MKTLGEAIHKSYPPYESIGIRQNGKYRQLNTSLLQIENEFYSPIRPKRVIKPGQTPLRALREGGVEYIEVRCLDVSPLQMVGIDADTIRFLDTFLIYCLLKESPECHKDEFYRTAENQARVVNCGRDPGLQIICGNKELPMRDCANSMLHDMQPVAEQFDQVHRTSAHMDSLRLQLAKVQDDSLTPSAIILKTLAGNHQSMLAYTFQQTLAYAGKLKSHAIEKATERKLLADVDVSLQKQRELEQDHSVSFEDYLAAYYRQ